MRGGQCLEYARLLGFRPLQTGSPTVFNYYRTREAVRRGLCEPVRTNRIVEIFEGGQAAEANEKGERKAKGEDELRREKGRGERKVGCGSGRERRRAQRRKREGKRTVQQQSRGCYRKRTRRSWSWSLVVLNTDRRQSSTARRRAKRARVERSANDARTTTGSDSYALKLR